MNTIKENKNKLILGDCLEVMKKMDSESIDLIYLDPPFFSNRNYEVIWGDAGEIRSFEDRWAGGIENYINWLYERVEQMHRLLKPTGSIYLHCDWHADAYIRVHILDKLFGMKNFRNHITWKRTSAHKSNKKNMATNTDSIFYYCKSEKFTYNEIHTGLSEEYIKKSYRYDDNDGRGKYMSSPLQDPHISKNHYQYKDFVTPTRGWLCTLETLKKLDEENKLIVSKNKNVRKKTYLSESKGVSIDNLWIDITDAQGSQRIGYPTQKPLALLDRIIKASSNKGDIVLDPFMGGGTTMVMASKLERRFIGIDQSVAAVDVTNNRLAPLDQPNELFSSHEIEKYYYAEEDLRVMPPFDFEEFIVSKFGGVPNEKKTGDRGIDGLKDGVPIQVKRWEKKVGRPDINKFVGAIQSTRLYKNNIEKRLPVGYFIAFDYAREAVEEVALLSRENIIIELVKVGDIVPLAKKPVVEIAWEKTEDGKYKFVATSDSTIINFSWDFEYGVPAHKHPVAVAKFNPKVSYDKKGVQVYNFSSAGSHNIAVKVIDDKSLENIAVCSISI